MSGSEDNRTPMDLMEYLDDFGYSIEDQTEMTSVEEDLPTALIVANIPPIIFEDIESQLTFERVFKELDADVSFIYLKNFRRARLQFSSSTTAGIARMKYDGLTVGDYNIKCYFSQVQQADKENTFLRPPEPKRVFLISPPASPPVGWEPIPESEPVIDYDLINALARLSPGESHEIHPKSMNAPAIVVHLCEDPVGLVGGGAKRTIIQTRRPNVNMI